MTGYASSSDECKNCENIIITVSSSDYFSSYESEVYSVSRDFAVVKKLKGEGSEFAMPHKTFQKIARLLHGEEIKNCCACVISWQSSELSLAEKIKTELLEDVWFPAPIYLDHCTSGCVNVTSLFFDDTPKPLMTSIVCDALNLIIAHTTLDIGHSFFNCMNSLYCSAELIEILAYMFCGCDCDSFEVLKNFKIKPRRVDIKKQILKPLSGLQFPLVTDTNNCVGIITNFKMEFISSVCKDLCRCIESKPDLKWFLSSFAKHTETFFSQLTDLSSIFVSAENINSISDVSYLTLYELHSAFSFFEDRLNLKKTVRHNRKRQRILNNLNSPLFLNAASDI